MEIYGYSDDDVKTGTKVSQLIELDIERGIVSADDEGARTARHRAKKLGKSQETFDLALTDGRWVQIRDRRTADGGTVSIHADITERKRAEELQRIILESIPLPLSVVRKSDGIFLYCNEPHAVLVGHRPENIIGTHAIDAYWDPSDRDKFIEILDKHNRVDDFEVERKDAHGKPYWALVSSRPITFQGEESILSAQTVITERKQAEEIMKKAKEDAEALSQSKSDFVAVVSHEVRTPMNGVLGMARLLLDTSLKKDQREYAETIVTSGDQLLTILNDLLDVSKLEAGKLDLEVIPFQPRRIMEDTVSVMATHSDEKGLAMNIAVEPGIPASLLGDPNRLRQILLNLLSNAIKFTQEGSVSLALDLIAKDEDKVSLCFSVTDTGEGISREARDRLFSAYTQESVDVARKYGGTGLGLVISRQLAELMGGELTLESILGEGSTFRLTAPFGLAVPGEPAKASADEPGEEQVRPLKVLLVEDNEVNRTVALNMLQKRGHDVTLAINGDEAVKRVRGQDFDAVLMDRHMPVLDGIEATRRIRRMKGPVSKIPIIGVTAAATKQELDACLAAGMDGCVTKPIDPNDLIAALSRLSGEKPVEAIVTAAPETGADAATQSSDQVLTPERLQTLRSDLGDESAKGLVAEFGRIAPELLEALLRAAEDGDEELFQRTAHSLKSSALIIGFERLAGRCTELEKSCIDDAFAHARIHTDGLDDCLAEALAVLENETWME